MTDTTAMVETGLALRLAITSNGPLPEGFDPADLASSTVATALQGLRFQLLVDGHDGTSTIEVLTVEHGDVTRGPIPRRGWWRR